MDYVVAFISQKGGVGKSTLARAVAREFHVNGFKVKLADMDVQQATTVNWHVRRLNAGLDPIGSVECYRTFSEAKVAAVNEDALVIDAAGRASAASAEIAAQADLVIQPSSPSLDDLQPGVLLFHELVKQGISMDKLRFALTMVSTEREEELGREYANQAGYKVLDGSLEFKTSYRSALNAGKTVTETVHKGVNTKADKLLQSIFSTLQELAQVDEELLEDNVIEVDPLDLELESEAITTSKQPDSSYLVESA